MDCHPIVVPTISNNSELDFSEAQWIRGIDCDHLSNIETFSQHMEGQNRVKTILISLKWKQNNN